MKTLPESLLEKPKLSSLVWETFKLNKHWAIAIIFLRSASLSADLFWPLFNKYMTDELISMGQNAFSWLNLSWCIALGLVSWYIQPLAGVAVGVISSRRVAAMRASVRQLFLKDMYKQSQQFFHDRFSGSISTSLRDISDGLSDIVYEIVFQFIPAFFLFVSLGFVMFKMHFAYILVLLVWMVFQVCLIRYTQKQSQLRSKNYADKRSELFGKIIDSISNHLSVTSFTATEHEQARIKETETQLIDRRAHAMHYHQGVTFISASIEVLFVFAGILPIYLYQFQKGEATVGDLMLILLGIYGMMKVVQNISERMLVFYEQIGTCQDALQKIAVPKQITDAADAKEIIITKAGITIDDINFAYLENRPVLQNVSFQINSGEKVGLVGYSGAGKTTFVNLLMRFYDVTKGNILIDGQDIRDVTQDSLRGNIAMIPQDTSLFHRTLFENIRIARPEASDEEIIAAAKMAGAHNFILTLVNGYDTLVGERGVKLSGGQRQRVAIARAFLKAAPILILDEATSALDSVTEKSIQDALNTVMTGRTTIVIAHRLSTLRQMDRILVFDQGRIIEQGSHEELLTHNGKYAQMWAMQAGGFLPEHENSATS